jgi:antitoxin component of MazEF toxin-antitoxin module
MEQIDGTTIAAIGVSLYVRIPKPTAKIMGLVKGTRMNIYRNGDEIIFKKVEA